MLTASTIAPQSATAQNITALKTGERTTGMTKQCYYDAVGQVYTRAMRSIDICPLSILVPAPASPSMLRPPAYEDPRAGTMFPSPPTYQAPRVGTTTPAFKAGEQRTGMTKQCFYNALGREYIRTVAATALCPPTIDVPL